MHKVLIVDDEVLVRTGIMALIDWEKHRFRICGQAADGQEALAIIEKERPDIVITDIVMPNMDGLRLIEEGLKRYPSIQFIVLSCRNDYAYVRQALKAGAADYLLKLSMMPDTLLSILKDVAKKLEGIGKNSQTPERILAECIALKQDPAEDEKIVLRSLLGDRYMLASLLPVAEDRRSPVHSAVSLFQAELNNRSIPNLPAREEGVTAWMLGAGSRTVKELADKLEKILEGTEKTGSLGLRVGISLPAAWEDSFAAAWEQCMRAREQGFCEEGRVIVFKEPPKVDKADLFLRERAEELQRALTERNGETSRTIISHVLDTVAQNHIPMGEAQVILLDLLFSFRTVLGRVLPELDEVGHGHLHTLIRNFSSMSEARAWFLSFAQTFCENLEYLHANSRKADIHALCADIAHMLDQPCTLGWAAQRLCLSEGYLSHLFRETTGESYTAYLMRLRLKKAAELLRITHESVDRISVQVGYPNTAYFCRLFKREMGVSPGRFRQMPGPGAADRRSRRRPQ